MSKTTSDISYKVTCTLGIRLLVWGELFRNPKSGQESCADILYTLSSNPQAPTDRVMSQHIDRSWWLVTLFQSIGGIYLGVYSLHCYGTLVNISAKIRIKSKTKQALSIPSSHIFRLMLVLSIGT